MRSDPVACGAVAGFAADSIMMQEIDRDGAGEWLFDRRVAIETAGVLNGRGRGVGLTGSE